MLFAKGLTLSQIMIVQSAYSGTILVAELPSGIIADLFNRKALYLISRGLMAAYLVMVVYFHGFGGMLLAWCVYALAVSLDSGTIDAAVVNYLKKSGLSNDGVEGSLSWFTRRDSQLQFVGMALGSAVGAAFYYSLGDNVYYFSLAFVVAGVCSILFFHKIDSRPVVRKSERGLGQVRNHVGGVVAEFRSSRRLRIFLLFGLLGQSAMQLHMQLWQAVALDEGFKEQHLYWLYLAFMGTSMLSGFLLVERLNKRNYLLWGVALTVTCAFWVARLESQYYLTVYLVVVFCLAVFANYCTYRIRSLVSIERIGALASFSNLVGRGGSVATLIAASFFLTWVSPATVFAAGVAVTGVVFALVLLSAKSDVKL